MKELVIYVHGKGGETEETEHYKPLFPKSDVIGFDYKSQNPWETKNEFSEFYDLNTKGYMGAVKIGEEGKSYCDFMKNMMQDMGKEKFEEIIQGAYEDTQRYILCYRLGL